VISVSGQGPAASAHVGCRLLAIVSVVAWAAPLTGQTNGPATGGSSSATTTPVQETTDANPGAMTLSASVDLMSRYMFRGIRQQSTGIAIWPAADISVAAYSGHGALKSVGISLGSWNSLHTGDTGTAGPSAKFWYEGDFYTTLGLGFGGGVSLAMTYTAYTSPNNSFSTVKELMFKLAVDDAPHLHKAALKPYVIVARELDTAPGFGQADGGIEAGTYLEVGMVPAYSRRKVSFAVPVKLGLSLRNYYEFDGIDHTFGYFSVGGIVTAPLGTPAKLGSWNLHCGAEFQRLGVATRAFNGGDGSQVIGSIGIGFGY